MPGLVRDVFSISCKVSKVSIQSLPQEWGICFFLQPRERESLRSLHLIRKCQTRFLVQYIQTSTVSSSSVEGSYVSIFFLEIFDPCFMGFHHRTHDRGKYCTHTALNIFKYFFCQWFRIRKSKSKEETLERSGSSGVILS